MKCFFIRLPHARVATAVCASTTLLLGACGSGVAGDAGPQLAASTTVVAVAAPAAAAAAAVGSNAPTGAQFRLAGYGHNPLDGIATVAASGNFYVATTGSDSADGSEAAPFKTIGHAAKVVTSPGAIVWVAPGTYAGGFQSTGSGAAGARLTFISTTKWGARLVAPGDPEVRVGWDNRGAHVSIIGFDVDGEGTDAWSHGIYTGGSYSVIQEKHVHHIANKAECNGVGGSAIGADSYFHGIQQDVLANTVHDIGRASCSTIQGIYMSTSGRVMNNLVYRVGSGAIHLWHDARNVTIANNTVASARAGIIVGGGNFYFSSGGADHTTVFNNVVYDTEIGISEQGKTGTSNRYMNNLFYQNETDIRLKNGLEATGTISSDPLFAGYASKAAMPNFRLSASSPAIGRGRVADAPAIDIDGKPRDRGNDVGACQY